MLDYVWTIPPTFALGPVFPSCVSLRRCSSIEEFLEKYPQPIFPLSLVGKYQQCHIHHGSYGREKRHFCQQATYSPGSSLSSHFSSYKLLDRVMLTSYSLLPLINRCTCGLYLRYHRTLHHGHCIALAVSIFAQLEAIFCIYRSLNRRGCRKGAAGIYLPREP